MVRDGGSAARLGRGAKRVSDEAIIESYRRTGSVHKTAIEVGLNHSSVHERLVRLGAAKSIAVFTTDEVARLRREYLIYRDAGRLNDLATAMGRTKFFLCRQARVLGLTDPRHGRRWQGKWKYMSEGAARALFETFKRAGGTMGQFCRRKGLDELGFARTLRRFFPDEWEHVIEAKAPRQTMYRLGRGFEYRVRDHLRGFGYVVLRSPRSGGPIDLVAVRRGAVLFIQCKRNGALGVSDWNALYELAGTAGSIPLLAESPRGRGVNYWRLLEAKDGTKRAQPRGAYFPGG